MRLKTYKKFFISVFLLTPLSLGIISCSGNNKSSPRLKEEITANFIPPITAVAALGQLSPSGEVRQLAAPVSQFGSSPRITELLVNEGDFVKKDDVLAIFENREKLISDLDMHNKLIDTVNHEISLKKDQIKRYELALSKDVYSFVQLSQRKDELLKLQKQKITYIGDKKNIEIDLFNSELRSPIDGFILEINTRVGERPTNKGILDIGSSQKMEALIEVYESDIDRVFLSQNVELSSENGGFKEILKGKVIRISPQVKQRKVLSTDPTGDADSRIVEVLVKLDKESMELVQYFSGMKVIAKFIP
ncbi:HlyD family efflux transporter periplasmic adaptor subunit [Prochlorococcus marinus]|uniref:HlyD family efflux transporter periplasmic adaptor subunit n=1 Tax=Prochlorococcus marinus TaxID=1219 RepID=UPI001ADAF297|nr:efflux RND transporter periplasmic adaptor subunit [Prochlorococcus marinus]MBO8204347.1 HlyD family efflux transporter periplasmic adaptor subunit [Prochlorococcus marinus CUG1415]MBW3043642.1 lipid ABC transporter permease [Prochlorococcus marinus str. MU1415]